jgi:hypothetical protein
MFRDIPTGLLILPRLDSRCLIEGKKRPYLIELFGDICTHTVYLGTSKLHLTDTLTATSLFGHTGIRLSFRRHSDEGGYKSETGERGGAARAGGPKVSSLFLSFRVCPPP